MDKHRLAPALLVVAIVIAGCNAAGSSGAQDPSAAAPTRTVASQVPPATSTPKPTPTATPTPTPYPTTPPGSLSLVGLGDSVPGALRCEAPCRSYVEVYGDLASAVFGQPVVAKNLATNDSLTSRTLMFRMQTEDEYRSAVAAADLITITIGKNDWQGPCFWLGHAFCLANGQKEVESNLGAILDDIARLRQGKPTAIRVTTLYDSFIGNPETADAWGFPRTEANLAKFHAFFSNALRDFNAMTCRVAQAHGAGCVDLLPVFNGPKGTKDAGHLLGPDHGHPSKAGQDMIAKAIADSGYAPLR